MQSLAKSAEKKFPRNQEKRAAVGQNPCTSSLAPEHPTVRRAVRAGAMKLPAVCVLALLIVVPAFARIGETEPQLVKRFGRPSVSESHQVSAHGLTFEVGQ